MGNVKYDDSRSTLIIPLKYSSVRIIDGQHRLYGFCHVDDGKRKNFNLVCTGFNVRQFKHSYLDEKKQADLFRTLNITAKKVSKELLIDLAIKLDLTDRKTRIVEKLIKEKYFEGKVKTIDTHGPIHITTLIETPPMERLVDDEGIISKWYGSNKGTKKVSEDFCLRIMDNYFRLVSNIFKNEWKRDKEFIIASDRGVRGLLRLMEDVLEYSNGLRDREKAKIVLRALRGTELRNSQLKGKYAGEGGADKLAADWRDFIRKKIPDFALKRRLMVVEKVIEPGQKEDAKEFIKGWFKKITGFDGNVVKGELAYIDPTTLDFLDWLPPECDDIRLLVSNVKDKEKCQEVMRDMEKRERKIEVYSIKLAEEREGEEHEYEHMRWLAGENYEIDFGTDLKEGSIGNKKHSIKIFQM